MEWCIKDGGELYMYTSSVQYSQLKVMVFVCPSQIFGIFSAHHTETSHGLVSNESLKSQTKKDKSTKKRKS